MSDEHNQGKSTTAAQSDDSSREQPGTVGAVLRRLGPAGPLALVSATLPAIGGVTLLFTLNSCGPWLRDHQGLGVVIYIAGFTTLAGLAVLPTYSQAILGGWAFGFAVGFPAAMAGFLGGSALGYVIGRRAAGDRVLRLIAEKPKWKAVYDALLGSGFGKTLLIISLVRLNSPFALTNFVLAATRVHPVAYLGGTALGLAPRTAAAVILAAGLKEVTADNPYQKWIWIGGIATAFVVILILGRLANQAVKRVTAAGESAAQEISHD